jgi:hypothetical protein
MVLALDALNCEAGLIDAAVRLAAALGTELDVLFVEDDDLYAAAELPITREILHGSARSRDLSPAGLASVLRSLSREAESRFRAAAAPGRFRVLRARRADALAEAFTDVDLLLLLPARRAPVRVYLNVQSAPHGRVFAICGATPASARALELGARLARRDHRALEVISSGPLDDALLTGLERTGLQIRRHRLEPDASLERALESCDSRTGNTLLVAADLPLATDRARLLEALSTLRCQSLLVN